MIKDRLAELQAKSTEAEEEKKGKYSKVDTMGDPLSNSLNKVSDLDEKIKKLQQDVAEFYKVQKNLVTRPQFDDNAFKNEVREMEKLSDKILTSSNKLQKEINEFRKHVSESDLSGTQAKMMNMHATRLASGITKLLNDFRAAQVEYINGTQKLHHKATIIIGNEESAGVSENNVQLDFGAGFLKEQQQARLELNEIQARDEELKKIESKVIEVNQLFKEINALITQQGEVIDNIEKTVNDATVTVESGKGQLNEARKNKKKWFRKKMCCIVIVVVAVLIIGGIIAIVIATG